MLFSEDRELRASVSRIVLPILHRPFLEITPEPSQQTSHTFALSPTQAVQTMQTLLTNTDPSPVLISTLLTPIVPALYSLSSTLNSIKTSDPALKASVHGFLRTWGRLVDNTEGIATVWLIVDGEGGDWKVDVAGGISRVERYAHSQ